MSAINLVVQSFLWLVLVCACVVLGTREQQLPLLKTTVTSHYDLGTKIGGRFKDEIKAAISVDSYFKSTILSYNTTEEGGAVYSDLYQAVKDNPMVSPYLDELKGLADGAGVDFSTMFLWNVQSELELLLRRATLTASCSDLYMKGTPIKGAMGHNEDGDKSDMATSYMVDAVILSSDAKMPLASFTAFCYPGELCGNAFGFNAAKSSVYTTNALFPRNIATKGIARNFINRATLSLSYDEIHTFLKSLHCASGFSLNIGDLGSQHMSNMEVSPEGVVQTVYTYGNGTGYHFNMYMHSKVDQWDDPSSEHRQQRVEQIAPPTSLADLRSILGDTKDKDYPIFRNSTPPDSGKTLATGIFDFDAKVLSVYRGNPSTQAPQVTLSMSVIPRHQSMNKHSPH